jgi:hypothetical protein
VTSAHIVLDGTFRCTLVGGWCDYWHPRYFASGVRCARLQTQRATCECNATFVGKRITRDCTESIIGHHCIIDWRALSGYGDCDRLFDVDHVSGVLKSAFIVDSIID